MTRRERKIKHRLLRELVAENVALKHGTWTPPPRKRRLGVTVAKVAALAAAPVAVLVGALVLSGAGGLGAAALPDESDGAVAAVAAVGATAPAHAVASTASAASTAGDDRLHLVSGAPIDAAIFPLGVRRIVLDPGHGGRNSGTRTPAGLEEKFLTLDIGQRVRDTLAEQGFEVILTRDTDVSITLQERIELANRENADIFVSIHVNWFEGSRESGIETYYLGPTDDPFLTRLAANENRESGHTLAEMRQLLDGIYAGVRQDKSADLAWAIQRALYHSLRRVNPDAKDRGVKKAPFLVLIDTRMPAVLAEVAALSSEAEAIMLERPLYRAYIADALAAGIVSYARSFDGPAQTRAPRRAETPAAVSEQKGS